MNPIRKASSRAENSLIIWLSLPTLAVLAYLFFQYVVPSMSPSAQDQLENGPGGVLLGFLFGAVVWVAAKQTWSQLKTGLDNRPVKV